MLDVGLSEANIFISSPFEIPPKIPPELFVSKPSTEMISLFSEPLIVTLPTPVPTSIALTAFTLISALANSASSFENTGEPIPGFSPLILTRIFAPIES